VRPYKSETVLVLQQLVIDDSDIDIVWQIFFDERNGHWEGKYNKMPFKETDRNKRALKTPEYSSFFLVRYLRQGRFLKAGNKDLSL
jgi:hypothetical protein